MRDFAGCAGVAGKRKRMREMKIAEMIRIAGIAEIELVLNTGIAMLAV